MKKPELKIIPIDQIQRGQYQPRREFDQEALQELGNSIKSSGLLQPIVVRPLSKKNQDSSLTNVQYEIIAGERRWRACQLIQEAEISCIVKHFSDEQTAEAAAIENIIRVDLNPIEVAKAYQRLIDEFGYLHEEVAAAVGKSRVKITNALRLLKLDNSVQDLIISGRLTEGHGKVLAALPHSIQRELATKCLARSWSVRKIEQEVKNLNEENGPASKRKDVNLKYLEKTVSDKIGCKTIINFDEDKGQMSIQFSNLDVLQGVLSKMNIDINDLKEAN